MVALSWLLRSVAIALAIAANAAHAEGPADRSCEHSASRLIPFEAPTASDLLIVAIGPGPCHLASFSFTVTSHEGTVLYRYVSTFKQHTTMQWDDPGLIDEARRLVEDTASQALVARSEIPAPMVPEADKEGDVVLAVPASVYERLLDSGQPMLVHSTYYEGTMFVMFDPVTNSARIVAQWSL